MKLIVFALFTTLFTNAYAKPVKFIAFGDAPYFDEAAYSMLDKLVLQTKKQNPDFVVHVGDIRGGRAFDCSDSTYFRVFDLFKKFSLPVVYTPGDNEWTDCLRFKTGANDPLERLQRLREIFFSDNKSIGKQSITMQLQSQNKMFSKYVENRRWINNDIMFMTLHIVSSANNRNPDNPTAMDEFLMRDQANIAWLEETFKLAKAKKLKALVMFYHANLLTDINSDKLSDQEKEKLKYFKSGFINFNKKLIEVSKAFKTPILAVHGDTHRFRVDHPLKTSKNQWGFEQPIPHFTRLEVYGAPEVRGVMVTVDTTKPQPFSITSMPQIEWEYPPPSESSPVEHILEDLWEHY